MLPPPHWLFQTLLFSGMYLVRNRRTVRQSNLEFLLLFDHSSLDCLREAGEDIPDKHSEGSNASQGKFGQLMSLKIVHVLSAFIIVYVGTEVTIGGM